MWKLYKIENGKQILLAKAHSRFALERMAKGVFADLDCMISKK